jgi:DNA mismatch repair protein MutS
MLHRFCSELDQLRGAKSNKDQIREKMTLHYRMETGIVSLEIKHNRILGLFIEIPSRSSDVMHSLSKFVFRQEVADKKRYRTMVRDRYREKVVVVYTIKSRGRS